MTSTLLPEDARTPGRTRAAPVPNHAGRGQLTAAPTDLKRGRTVNKDAVKRTCRALTVPVTQYPRNQGRSGRGSVQADPAKTIKSAKNIRLVPLTERIWSHPKRRNEAEREGSLLPPSFFDAHGHGYKIKKLNTCFPSVALPLLLISLLLFLITAER